MARLISLIGRVAIFLLFGNVMELFKSKKIERRPSWLEVIENSAEQMQIFFNRKCLKHFPQSSANNLLTVNFR